MDEKEKSISEEYEFSVILPDNDTSEQDVTLKVARTLEPLAKLKACLAINYINLEETEEKPDLTLLPAVLDEVISVKEINDIGKWKDVEKQKFEQELEKMRTKELKKLDDEWQLKKTSMEEELHKNMNKCKKLQDDLKNKVDMLKIEKYLISKRAVSKIYEDIFKENWEKFHEENTKELIELLSRTQRDNEHLREIIGDQKKELNILEKSTLTKTQTSNLLQELRGLEEKFEGAQVAKSYFKDQWKKACDEIHELKREDIENMQNQIQQDRQKLSQVSLDKFTNFQIPQSGDSPDLNSPDSVRSGLSGHFYFP